MSDFEETFFDKPKEEPEVEETKEVSKEDADKMLQIFDALLFEGVYRENVPLGKRYKATFRSRTAAEDNDISMRLDRIKFETIMAYQNQSSLWALAYSLEGFGDRNFSGLTPEQRFEAVGGLPSTVVVLLAQEIGKFDRKVMEALEYGKENF